jgi:VanZ family protein
VTARRWRTLLFALMGVAVLLALRPLTSEHSPEKWFRHSDKVGHLLLFAGLWVVALRAGFAAGWPLALILLAYGVSIEVAQAIAPTHRSASLTDVAADVAGIALAWGFTTRSARQPEEDRG